MAEETTGATKGAAAEAARSGVRVFPDALLPSPHHGFLIPADAAAEATLRIQDGVVSNHVNRLPPSRGAGTAAAA